jgi:hypothetical protein
VKQRCVKEADTDFVNAFAYAFGREIDFDAQSFNNICAAALARR